MKLSKIGVAGSGLMGGGIAQMFAEHGFNVILWDVDRQTADKGLDQIRKRLNRSVEKGGVTREQVLERMERISIQTDLERLASADIIIEAVVEDINVKRDLFVKFEKLASPDAILATNTSSLSVNDICSALKNGQRFLAMHFFNPPTRLELVEIVPARETSETVIGKVRHLLKACGKTPVVVKDSPGFIVNRLLLLLINEAARMVDEGVAESGDIDTALQLGALHPAGPLAVADLIGLDVCKKILDTLHERLGNISFKPARCIDDLVREGKLGRKSGQGFFKY